MHISVFNNQLVSFGFNSSRQTDRPKTPFTCDFVHPSSRKRPPHLPYNPPTSIPADLSLGFPPSTVLFIPFTPDATITAADLNHDTTAFEQRGKHIVSNTRWWKITNTDALHAYLWLLSPNRTSSGRKYDRISPTLVGKWHGPFLIDLHKNNVFISPIETQRLRPSVRTSFDISSSQFSGRSEMDTNEFTLYSTRKSTKVTQTKVKRRMSILTKRDELSLRTVLALPNASNTGLVWTTWSSNEPYDNQTTLDYYCSKTQQIIRFQREHTFFLTPPAASSSFLVLAPTVAKYAITFLVFSVFPAPDSPLSVGKNQLTCKNKERKWTITIRLIDLRDQHRLVFFVWKINKKIRYFLHIYVYMCVFV